jgi:hypothetical protein
MKRVLFVWVMFALILSACASDNASVPTLAPTEAPLPVIAIDVEHMINPGVAYEIPAGAGFVLDATGYDFGVAGGPTSVQVVLDSHAFTGIWKSGQITQTVRAESLLPPPGFNPLTGFPSGKQMIIAVGRISDKGRFEPLWVAVVNVQ